MAKVDANVVRRERRERRAAVDAQDAVDALVPELRLPPVRGGVARRRDERDGRRAGDTPVDPVACEGQHGRTRHGRILVPFEHVQGLGRAERGHEHGNRRKRCARRAPHERERGADEDDRGGEQHAVVRKDGMHRRGGRGPEDRRRVVVVAELEEEPAGDRRQHERERHEPPQRLA